MRLPRIFTQQPLEAGSIDLEPEPSRHIARALRMQAGDDLILFNGQGGDYAATIVAVNKKSVQVTIKAHHAMESESPLQIHLGIALSRGERFDWAVQKATELGVHAISPLFTERTGVKLGQDRAHKKLRHWQQIAVSACEQCGRNRLPAIAPPQAMVTWLQQARSELKVMLHTSVEKTLLTQGAVTSIDLLTGPEGGFSDAEVNAAQSAGFMPLQLGPRVLRTETAPVAALAVLQARWGDMGID